MKKVILYAYAGTNLGDDLFIKILCERYPKIKFILFAPRKYRLLTKDLKNLYIIPSDSLIIRIINKLFKLFNIKLTVRNIIGKFCDVGVQIGGSIFMQRKGWKENIERKKRMLVKNQPFYVLGANFGPYYDEEFYIASRRVIKKYTDICFRDNYSYDLFQDLNNVRIADDIVFQLKNNYKYYSKHDNKNIVISVIKPSFREELKGSDDIYYNKIKEIILFFLKKDHDVTLISFCENEGDNEAIENIIYLLPNKYKFKVKKHFYNLNIEETLQLVSSSNFVVATRFHSMILGWIFNKPVYPIAYSDKMTNVMVDIGFKGKYSTFNALKELNAHEVYNAYLKNEVLDISKQVINSENHFKELDKVLAYKTIM